MAHDRDGPDMASGVQPQPDAPAPQPPSSDAIAAAAPVEASAASSEPPAGPSAGEQLRAERERQGLSVVEVARQLKLSPRQLDALERDDHSSLPGSVFVRGFMRNYARALGLDADALVRLAFGATGPEPAIGATVPSAPLPAASPPDRSPLNVSVDSGAPRRRGGTAWFAVGVVVAVVALVAVVLLAGRGPATAPSTEVALVPAPVAVQPPEAAREAVQAPAEAAAVPETSASLEGSRAAPEPVPSGAGSAPSAVIGTRGPEMRFSFSRESWVEIRDGDDRVIFSQLNPEGSERVIRGKPPLELVVGSASGVALTYRGKPVDLGPHTRTDVARLTLE